MTVALPLTFLVSFCGTWLLTRYAPALRLVDVPNSRSSHIRPTPSGGGIAVVVASVLGELVLPGGIPAAMSIALYAALPVALIGLADDRFNLSARLRLSVHLVAASAVVLPLALAESMTPPFLIGYLVGLLMIAWATNLFNFMDGIDGIAAGQAIYMCGMAGALLFTRSASTATALWIIGSASAGFLFWNWNPARIFMGDVGSSYLGFLLASIAAITIALDLLTLPVWLILSGTFLADTGVTLLRRVARGKKWWIAHRSHAFQRLNLMIRNHGKTTLLFMLVNALFLAPLAVLADRYATYGWLICGFALLPLIAGALLLGAGKDDEVIDPS